MAAKIQRSGKVMNSINVIMSNIPDHSRSIDRDPLAWMSCMKEDLYIINISSKEGYRSGNQRMK